MIWLLFHQYFDAPPVASSLRGSLGSVPNSNRQQIERCEDLLLLQALHLKALRSDSLSFIPQVFESAWLATTSHLPY